MCKQFLDKYVIVSDLEELKKFKNEFNNELKNEIEKIRSDLSQKISYLYESMLNVHLPVTIQSHWKLVPVFSESYKVYKR
jgi:hypothetical protein